MMCQSIAVVDVIGRQYWCCTNIQIDETVAHMDILNYHSDIWLVLVIRVVFATLLSSL